MPPFCGLTPFLRPFALALALLLALSPAAAQERPWEGFLPDPDQGFGEEERPDSEWLGVRVLDAATGRPVPGARWVRSPEWINAGRRRDDTVMGVAVTDGEGIAHLPAVPWGWSDDCHWLVLADGYAPAYEYAAIPETEILLEKGRPFRGILLDPLGRPVAGGVVEYLCGCSHGTAALRAVAGADGSFTLPDHLCRQGQYWVEGPGIASDLLAADEPDSLGARPGLIVGAPGLRYEGRVLDLMGTPLPDCVVRAWNEQRGPATITGADGRFVLEGVEPRASLVFFPRACLTDDAGALELDDARPGVPMTVVLGPMGIPGEEESARVLVRAHTPDGEPAGEVWFQLLRVDTGRGPEDRTEDGEEDIDDPGEAVCGESLVDLPPGRYRVVPTDGYTDFADAYTFDPVEVAAAAGETAEVAITVRPRPRLRIRGEVPEGANLVLAIPGATLDERWDAEDPWSPALPAGGPAALRVELDGAPPFFFPVGPVKEGFREAVVSLPPPRRVVLPKGARDGELLDGDREVACREAGEGVLETWAEGRVTAGFRDGEKRRREVDIDLHPVEGGSVEIRPTDGRVLPGEVTVRLLARGEGGEWEEAESEETEPGETVVFRDEGMQTLRCIAAPGGPNEVRRGACRLLLHLLDAEGERADALVSVDGEIHPAPEGRLDLGGLDPGPHRVLAAFRDEVGGGRDLTVVLEEGEPREHTVRLGE